MLTGAPKPNVPLRGKARRFQSAFRQLETVGVGVIMGALEWGDEIFGFHDTDRATNGRLEGNKAKLGVLKRITYRFISATNFAH